MQGAPCRGEGRAMGPEFVSGGAVRTKDMTIANKAVAELELASTTGMGRFATIQPHWLSISVVLALHNCCWLKSTHLSFAIVLPLIPCQGFAL